MDDVSARINELLSDPESVEKIKSIAAALAAKSSDEGAGKKEEVREPTKEASTTDTLSKFLPLIGEFADGEKDSKVLLLRALKPYLTGDREKRMDDAVLILKLAKVASKASDMGLINLDFLKDINILKDLNIFRRGE